MSKYSSLSREELERVALAAESSRSEAVKALDNADAALGEATAILGGEYGDHYATLCDRMLQLADDISAIRSRAAVLDSDKM